MVLLESEVNTKYYSACMHIAMSTKYNLSEFILIVLCFDMTCYMVCVCTMSIYIYINFIDVQRILIHFHVIIPVSIWDWNDYCHLAINIYTLEQQMIFSRYQYYWYVH